MKKYLAMLLAVVMLLAMLPTAALAADTEEVDTEEVDTQEAVEESIDYSSLLAAHLDDYPADTEVLTVNGRSVTWDIYYYYLASGMLTVASYIGTLPEDLNEDIGNGTTFDEYFRGQALQNVIFYAQTLNHAEENGIELGEEELTTLESIRVNGEETYGGHEGYVEQMRKSCLTENAFTEYMRFNLLGTKMMNDLYIEPVTETDAEQWAAENEKVRAKHILLKNTDETGEAVDEETLAHLMERMVGYREELLALEGDNEALEARFNELMAEYSEDPGSQSQPDGYVFGKGEMVQEFEEAAFALENYRLSDIVETSYGYHLLLRLPITLDTTAGYDSSTYQSYTVRTAVGQSRFSADSESWITDADVEWNEEFQSLSLNDLLSHETAAEETGFFGGMTLTGWIITGLVVVLAVALVLVLLRQAADRRRAAAKALAAAEVEPLPEVVDELTEAQNEAALTEAAPALDPQAAPAEESTENAEAALLTEREADLAENEPSVENDDEAPAEDEKTE